MKKTDLIAAIAEGAGISKVAAKAALDTTLATIAGAVKAIAYVLRNPMSAGIQIMPGEYRWSSTNLYFASRSFVLQNYTPISSLPVVKMREITGSRCKFPAKWRIDMDGMIFPGDYVDYKTVETIFVRPMQLLYYILKNNDAVGAPGYPLKPSERKVLCSYR